MQLAKNATIAGRFRLNRLLGRGGMGSVWHATHLGLDVPCAVKFIEGERVNRAEAAVRFEREAKAAAQLRSPHVVQILDHGIFEGTPYIAMELLEGEDLGKRLKRVRRLPPQEVVAVVRDVARALRKAHACGIVHRDLKPDNIFLVHDDDREIAKVLDFGIAKMKTSDLTAKTRTGELLGTPHYMSPEQAQGTREIDWRSDLWSLGVITFECITGVRPFDSDALGDLLLKIFTAPIPAPSAVADVPAGLDTWWAQASARDPAARFQSAVALADALADALTGSVITGPVRRLEAEKETITGDSGVEVVFPSPSLPTPSQTQPAMAGHLLRATPVIVRDVASAGRESAGRARDPSSPATMESAMRPIASDAGTPTALALSATEIGAAPLARVVETTPPPRPGSPTDPPAAQAVSAPPASDVAETRDPIAGAPAKTTTDPGGASQEAAGAPADAEKDAADAGDKPGGTHDGASMATSSRPPSARPIWKRAAIVAVAGAAAIAGYVRFGGTPPKGDTVPSDLDGATAAVDVVNARDVDARAVLAVLPRAKLADCYKSWLQTTQDRSKVTATLYLSIDRRGHVDGVGLEAGPTMQPTVARCVEDVMSHLSLRRGAVAEGGATADVSLAFDPPK